VEEITTASKEQANALDQINSGLSQIDQVTQSNTANAEESAAAGEELSSQATELKSLVARFRLKTGASASSGFLFDNRDNFFSSGFNVAVVNKPSDVKDLDFDFRSGPEHVEDLRQVVAYLKKEGGLPIWLVGTSRGTISATAAAIAFGNNELAGIVLTSSITAWWKNGDVPSQDLEAIRIPVLVVHHALDSCSICVPAGASRIIQSLTNAPVKKLILVSGGGPPSGDECTSSHWHGFVGQEQEVVRIIAEWIKKPVN
jgi:hypothetical protein